MTPSPLNGIEFAATPNGNPPDRQSGQAACAATTWVREIVNGEPRPWVRAHLQSTLEARLVAFWAVAGSDPYGDALREGRTE